MLRKFLWVVLFSFTINNAAYAAASEWVYGNVDLVDDYGAYNGGYFQVMISLSNRTNVGPLATQNCTGEFRVATGAEGVTEDIKKRIFAMALVAQLTGRKLRLYVDPTTGPYCYVQIGGLLNP